MAYSKALITGGAGFIGTHLSNALLTQGMEVTILDNLSTGRLDNVPSDAHFYQGDIRDTPMVERVLGEEKTEVVFHLAARVSIRDSMAEFSTDADNNIMGTLSLLSACRTIPVAKFIYASSMAVYADSPNP